ncbi:hypothetical protein VNI00_001018 [Paramarasmius palmivorus]|uniref:Uncharacterized protein n=1 Tax=Paramarasmius palmivorus TaxID=297713 RepID=A0AAW0EAH3_9AGAR
MVSRSQQNSPSKEARLQAIREALEASQEATQNHQALSEAEVKMERANAEWEDAEANLTNCLDQMTLSADKYSASVAAVRNIYGVTPHGNVSTQADHPRTPNRQHTRSAVESPRTRTPRTPRTNSNPNNTPRANAGTNNPEPASTPTPAPAPDVFQDGSPLPNPGGLYRSYRQVRGKGLEATYVGSSFPAYLVYVGPNKEHRLFYSWETILQIGVEGAKEWLAGAKMTYYKGFTSSERARQYFRECEETGVFDALKVEPRQRGGTLYYIVSRGVKPGVYSTKHELIRDGLQWRGGQVTVWDGEEEGAMHLLNHWRAEHKVGCYTPLGGPP